MSLKQKILDSDVLVIGAGGAGLRAAIEARKRGVSVRLVTKADVPSGCSAVAMGAMQAACGATDSPVVHLKDTMEAGTFLNDRRLVQVMVNEAFDRVLDLEEYGTKIIKDNESYRLFPFPGCTHPRAILTVNPYAGGFTSGLVKEVKARQIRVRKNVMITRLLTNDYAVVGATGVDLLRGELLTFRSRSTILASGGAGQLYDLTTNPEEATGDGFAMAYRAGAELMDMEFTQSRACIIYPSELRGKPPPGDGLVTIGGRFFNALGERYMKKHDPINKEKVTRDLVTIRTSEEIKAGRATKHGGVYNDLSDVPEVELKRFRRFMNICQVEGIDPRWQPIEWAPGIHHFMGGVRINERCETSIRGLYAAGEVTAGIHGANRVGANALTDTQVFGARAGRFAAEKALSIGEPEIQEMQIEEELNEISKILERKHGVVASKVRSEIQTIMCKYVGTLRERKGLELAVHEIREIKRKKLPKLRAKHRKDLIGLKEIFEVVNLAVVAEVVAQCALMRKESRGAHFREDFPHRNEKNWLKNIVICFEGGKMKSELVRPYQ